MCKKSLYSLLFLLAFCFTAAAQTPPPPLTMLDTLKILTLSETELFSSKEEIKSLRIELANSSLTINNMQTLIEQQRKDLERALQKQTERRETSKTESTDSSTIIESLRTSYNDALLKNHDQELTIKSKNKTILRLTIALSVIGLAVVATVVFKLLRLFRVIPV
jgi:hypothetical protein